MVETPEWPQHRKMKMITTTGFQYSNLFFTNLVLDIQNYSTTLFYFCQQSRFVLRAGIIEEGFRKGSSGALSAEAEYIFISLLIPMLSNAKQ